MLADLTKPFLVAERNLVFLPDTVDFRPYAIGAPSRKVNFQGVPLLAIENNPALNHLLYAAGMQLPSPLYASDYDWSFQVPYATQIETAGMIVARRRCYVLSDLGVGKTLAALLAIDWLLLHKYVEKVLVVCPLSIVRHIWEDEILMRMPRLKPVVVHASTREQRLDLLKHTSWNVAIINFDGLKVLEDELAEINFGMVVFDELATLRTHTTKTWHSASEVVKNASFAVGLTGSPTPNGPWDAYGQARLLTPERIRSSYNHFKMTVGTQVNERVWLPKPDAKDRVYRIMQPAVRFKRSDVIELKDVHHRTVTCDISAAQATFVKELKTNLVAQYKEGLVEATNAAVLVGKLLQAYGGAVYTTDKSIVDLKANDRLAIADSLIEAAEGKVILFTAYRHIAQIVAARLAGRPFNREASMIVLDRDLNQRERYDRLARFQDRNDRSRLLISHPKLMAHGLNLTVADTIIWYMPTTSYETYQQANGRITRMGQTREQLIYHIRASPAEDKVYSTLARNGNMQEALLELFETHFE